MGYVIALSMRRGDIQIRLVLIEVRLLYLGNQGWFRPDLGRVGHTTVAVPVQGSKQCAVIYTMTGNHSNYDQILLVK